MQFAIMIYSMDDDMDICMLRDDYENPRLFNCKLERYQVMSYKNTVIMFIHIYESDGQSNISNWKKMFVSIQIWGFTRYLRMDMNKHLKINDNDY